MHFEWIGTDAGIGQVWQDNTQNDRLASIGKFSELAEVGKAGPIRARAF